MNKYQTPVFIPIELHRSLKYTSAILGISMKEAVGVAIESWLKEQEETVTEMGAAAAASISKRS